MYDARTPPVCMTFFFRPAPRLARELPYPESSHTVPAPPTIANMYSDPNNPSKLATPGVAKLIGRKLSETRGGSGGVTCDIDGRLLNHAIEHFPDRMRVRICDCAPTNQPTNQSK